MEKIKNLFKTSLIGGLLVILPVALLYLVFRWVFNLTTRMIGPLTNLILVRSDLKKIVVDILVILFIMAACFVIGLIVKTRVGKFVHENLENLILKAVPGYNMIKEILMQFLGRKKFPFLSVALIQIYESETLVTAFITDEHQDGSYTVFMPTGPNPTTGFIFHMPAKYVHPISISVEEAMRSVIACGAGSSSLVSAYIKNKKKSQQ